MKNQKLILSLTAIIAFGGGLWFQTLSPRQSAIEDGRRLLSATQGIDLAGQQHRLSEWHGKILIVNFWATWCPPCLAEIPQFILLQRQYAESIQFIGIAVDESNAVMQFNRTARLNYPLLIAGDYGMASSKSWGNLSGVIPFTVVIDLEGKIIHRQFGSFSREQLLAVIKPLLKLS